MKTKVAFVTQKQLNKYCRKSEEQINIFRYPDRFFLDTGCCAETEITGKITEKETGNPIPYANIVFTGTYIGTMSDINGNFSLNTAKPTATIEVSAIGYVKQVFPVKINQKNVLM